MHTIGAEERYGTGWDLFRVKVRGRGCDAILWYAAELITKQICPEKIPGGVV
jgi:hypothetical protein